jgi:hypothetical protein
LSEGPRNDWKKKVQGTQGTQGTPGTRTFFFSILCNLLDFETEVCFVVMARRSTRIQHAQVKLFRVLNTRLASACSRSCSPLFTEDGCRMHTGRICICEDAKPYVDTQHLAACLHCRVHIPCKMDTRGWWR